MSITKNFDTQLTNLDGEILKEPKLDDQGKGIEIPVLPINKLIAGALQNYTAKDGDNTMDLYEWALLINKGGDIELERADYTKITEIIKKTYTNVLVQAQIVKLLDA